MASFASGGGDAGGGTLTRVRVTSEVFSVCAVHALTTDSEEIMGLLLGDVSGDGRSASVWGVSVQVRSDKRKDRVEIAPEALSAAAEEAEALGQRLGRPTRVVGWYHSHPHITVHASHVDVRTQHDYQRLDRGFVGLIVSVFGRSGGAGGCGGRLQLVAFQSRAQGDREGREVPCEVLPLREVLPDPAQAREAARAALANLVRLQRTLLKEERDAYHLGTFVEDGARDAGVPPEMARFPSGVLSPGYDASAAAAPGDPIDTLYSGAALPVRHPLAALHNAGVYQKALSKLLEYGCLPVLQSLTLTARAQRDEAAALRAENERLEAELAELKNKA